MRLYTEVTDTCNGYSTAKSLYRFLWRQTVEGECVIADSTTLSIFIAITTSLNPGHIAWDTPVTSRHICPIALSFQPNHTNTIFLLILTEFRWPTSRVKTLFMLNMGISNLFVYNFTFPSYPRVAPGCSDSQFSRLGNHSECNKTLKWKLITTIF